MKNYFKSFLLFNFFVLIFPGFSKAFDKLPDTGQTTSYTNTFGEDSDYNINPQSYTKLDATGNALPDDAIRWTMVRDNVTGLVWEVKQDKDGSSDLKNVHDADNIYTWCDTNPATNGGNAGTCGIGTDTTDFIAALNDFYYGGHADWRMPTVKELSTIGNNEINSPSISISFFPNTMASYYWSSTPHAAHSDSAWYVKFDYNAVSSKPKSNGYSVRAVRGEQSGASNNFVDNTDGTVTDTATGLMWQQTTQTGLKSWESAIADCESLSLADYTDWRLPNRNELQSLVDYSTHSPAIDTSFFFDQDPWLNYYWSSTTYTAYSAYAWYVFFNDGLIVYNDKSTARYFVRAVRGGQSEPESVTLPFILLLLLK